MNAVVVPMPEGAGIEVGEVDYIDAARAVHEAARVVQVHRRELARMREAIGAYEANELEPALHRFNAARSIQRALTDRASGIVP